MADAEPVPAVDPADASRQVRTTRNRGRTTPEERARLAALAPTWTVPADTGWDPISLAHAFGRSGPLYVDIGVGSGEATRRWATDDPAANVLAIEVHPPSVVRLVDGLDAHGPANVRVAVTDACGVVEALEPGTAAAVRLLFPDPWPKRRHRKRRMVDDRFARHLSRALAPGGRVEVATDWNDYANQIRTVLTDQPTLRAVETDRRPDRPTTSYERRARRAGRPVVDLVWQRLPVEPTST